MCMMRFRITLCSQFKRLVTATKPLDIQAATKVTNLSSVLLLIIALLRVNISIEDEVHLNRFIG